MYTKKLVHKGFLQTPCFDNDCMHPQFEGAFKYSNFRTVERPIELLQFLPKDDVFELYWVRDMIVCCSRSEMLRLLRHWISSEEVNRPVMEYLVHEIELNRYKDFQFLYYLGNRDQQVGEWEISHRIAGQMMMERKLAVYEFGSDLSRFANLLRTWCNE